MTPNKLSLKEKIGYGFGDAASSMFWKIFGMYSLFFYTDVFGITAAAAGTMFLVARLWDSFFDVFVGILADRTKTRWGKYRPYLLWFAIPFAVMGAITFFAPDFAQTGKLIYAYITYSLMMIVYSMINVPYASLLGAISSSSSFFLYVCYIFLYRKTKHKNKLEKKKKKKKNKKKNKKKKK